MNTTVATTPPGAAVEANPRTDDELLLTLARAARVEKVKSNGRSGESRAWQRSGNVD